MTPKQFLLLKVGDTLIYQGETSKVKWIEREWSANWKVWTEDGRSLKIDDDHIQDVRYQKKG